MEEQIKGSHSPRLPLYLIIILLINILSLLGFFWWSKKNCVELNPKDEYSAEIGEEEEEILTVNYNNSGKEYNGYAYFQLQFSSKYSVVSTEMGTSYLTQGGFQGMHWPVLYFLANGQKALLGEKDDSLVPYITVATSDTDYKNLENWDKLYLEELESFISPVQPTYKVVGNVKKIDKENYTIYKRSVKWSDYSENSLQAFIFIPGEIAYIFESTGVPEKDFDFIVDSLKIRGFYNFD